MRARSNTGRECVSTTPPRRSGNAPPRFFPSIRMCICGDTAPRFPAADRNGAAAHRPSSRATHSGHRCNGSAHAASASAGRPSKTDARGRLGRRRDLRVREGRGTNGKRERHRRARETALERAKYAKREIERTSATIRPRRDRAGLGERWGGRGDSNPRQPESQSGTLTN